MKTAGNLKLLTLSAYLIAVVGCAGAPTQEMSDARQALGAAREAAAAKHAPGAFAAAEGLLREAESARESGDYRTARQVALQSRQKAVNARNLALAFAEAESALEHAKASGYDVREVREMILSAKRAAAGGDEKEAIRLVDEAARRLAQFRRGQRAL